MFNSMAIYGIDYYQQNISPHKGYSCAYKYYEGGYSCSEYTRQCIIKYGILRAIPLFKERIEKCRKVYFSTNNTKPKKEIDKCNEMAGVCACL